MSEGTELPRWLDDGGPAPPHPETRGSPADCRHEWREVDSGVACSRCGVFFPHGCAPWAPDDADLPGPPFPERPPDPGPDLAWYDVEPTDGTDADL